jgi:RHS repeat-associated protein
MLLATAQAETTVYVNKFFEVRDHDQPTKYVFQGETRVARVTGSLSKNNRIQRQRLHRGWNLLSLAVAAPDALHQITNARSSVITAKSVFQWKPGGPTWQPIAGGETLSAGTVLWCYATTNTTLAITGAYFDPTNRPIAFGSAFLPGAGLEASPLPESSNAVSFSAFGSAIQKWLLYVPGMRFADADFPKFLAPGSVVFANSGATGQLEIPDPTLRIRYYHQDHLGSSSVITDAQGVLVEETAFYPFGSTRNEHRLRQIEEGEYKFAQKERDPESGLSYFASRFLASGLSRFIRADSLAFAMPDEWLKMPQKLNVYSYVCNNPLRFVDPTGMDREKPSQGQGNRVLVMYGESQSGQCFQRLILRRRYLYRARFVQSQATPSGRGADHTGRFAECSRRGKSHA